MRMMASVNLIIWQHIGNKYCNIMLLDEIYCNY